MGFSDPCFSEPKASRAQEDVPMKPPHPSGCSGDGFFQRSVCSEVTPKSEGDSLPPPTEYLCYNLSCPAVVTNSKEFATREPNSSLFIYLFIY